MSTTAAAKRTAKELSLAYGGTCADLRKDAELIDSKTGLPELRGLLEVCEKNLRAAWKQCDFNEKNAELIRRIASAIKQIG